MKTKKLKISETTPAEAWAHIFGEETPRQVADRGEHIHMVVDGLPYGREDRRKLHKKLEDYCLEFYRSQKRITVSDKRRIAYIPHGGWTKGNGHRVAFVTENERGYNWTGNTPEGGDVEPWYWGDKENESKSLKAAQETAKEYNAKLDIDAKPTTSCFRRCGWVSREKEIHFQGNPRSGFRN